MGVSGYANSDPGSVLDKCMDAGTVWGEHAAEDPGVVSGTVNFDPGLVLASFGGAGTV